ncbi:MAG TPA: 4Fe-4S binding protein [Syntrophales bacterium]|nr:4Fe-4S binding protein [Syntrophales bacterium]HQB30535.1 4Fe-4S binding protein [Syntrophales bacterium]HQN77790.1 4Fe-4S binding protein [Syntrophales bacterium]HQQ27857.1 4Fe-4S binding protein [Syntrophales bacterium]
MVYERLRKHLDAMPAGFPATESGVEILILKKLFTEEEAETACRMNLMPETAEQAAERLGRDAGELADLLYRMSKKGLLMRTRSGDRVFYMSAMFLVGIFEYQVDRLDAELVELFRRYTDEAMAREMLRYETPQLRVVPVGESLDPSMEIAPYDEARKILASQKTIALAECICRKMSAVRGTPCHAPIESCFAFGAMGEYYIENGIGRRITLEEALRVLERNEKAGLVPSPANAQRVGGMCSCCSCCCEILKALKKDAAPGGKVKSNFYAELDGDLCTGCGACLDRCQMDAISMAGETAAVNRERCLGCGLCVVECPVGAIVLKEKAPDERYVPPERPAETYLRIAMERKRT